MRPNIPENLDQEHVYTKTSLGKIYKTVGFVLIFALLITAIILGLNYDRLPSISPLGGKGGFELVHFSNQEEMKRYLENAPEAVSGFGGDMRVALDSSMRGLAESQSAPAIPSYYSQTNVQVAGIDEPDIVKTNGEKIFVSTQTPIYRIMQGGFGAEVDTEIYPAPDVSEPKTKIVNAFPPQDLGIDNSIETAGELLLDINILIISNGKSLTGFDVSDSKNPQEVWNIKFDNSQIKTLRLMNGQIYAVIEKNINHQAPCPISLLENKNQQIDISCSQIYHPINPTAVDTTYTVLKINPDNGQASDPISFVGSSLSSIVYMSQNALYITNQNQVSTELAQLNFLLSDGQDLLPQSYIDRLIKVSNLEISNPAKSTEVNVILQEYLNSLTEDQAMKLGNDFQNRFSKYLSEQMRKLQTTNITKIELKNLEISATGQVPGQILNQFALDEYGGVLRVATTIGGGGLLGAEPANDIYTLDENLSRLGAISNLGLDEQIYAVRFINDKAYLVTFKQTDPFYIIGLQDPQKPAKLGELKIPGYSSYLHPLSEDVMLGIGKEDQFVKLTLFDISNETPTELNTYITETYWSEALDNHHAFSIDPKGNTFFLPTNKGGLIFGYQNNLLSLKQAISGLNLKRAVYIDNYLYVIGDDLIVVLDKQDWEIISELDLN